MKCGNEIEILGVKSVCVLDKDHEGDHAGYHEEGKIGDTPTLSWENKK